MEPPTLNIHPKSQLGHNVKFSQFITYLRIRHILHIYYEKHIKLTKQ